MELRIKITKYWLMVIGLFAILIIIGAITSNQYVNAAGSQSPALATLAALDSTDWSDFYSFESAKESAAQCKMNGAAVLRTGKVPGTDIDLTADQKAQITDKIIDCAAKEIVTNQASKELLGVTDSQLTLLAQTRGFEKPKTSKQRDVEASATRAALPSVVPSAVSKGVGP